MRRFAWIARLAVAAALLAWVLSRKDVRAGLTTAHFAHPWWLVAAIACGGVACIAEAWRWHWCLRACDCALPFGSVVRIAFAGRSAGLVSVGALGVDAVRVALASRQLPSKQRHLIASVTLDHVSALPALALFAIIAVSAVRVPLQIDASVLESIGVGVALMIVAVLLVRWLFPAQHERFVGYALARLRAPGTAVAAAISVPMMLAHYGIFWCVAHALAITAPGSGLFGAIFVADSIAALPISIAGIGVREKSFEFLLKLWYDIAPALSITASLTGFLIVAGWSIGGLLALPTRHLVSREPS